MKGDEQYKYILSVKNLMYQWGKRRVVEIIENGKCIEHPKIGRKKKQKRRKKSIQVNTVIASIAREVNLVD